MSVPALAHVYPLISHVHEYRVWKISRGLSENWISLESFWLHLFGDETLFLESYSLIVSPLNPSSSSSCVTFSIRSSRYVRFAWTADWNGLANFLMATFMFLVESREELEDREKSCVNWFGSDASLSSLLRRGWSCWFWFYERKLWQDKEPNLRRRRSFISRLAWPSSTTIL